MLSFMRGIGARTRKTVPTNNPVSSTINILGVGQSLMAYLSDNYGGNGEAAMLAELQPAYFGAAAFNNQAKNGSPLTKAAADILVRSDNWWDETASAGAGGKGPTYIDRVDPIANKNEYQAIVFAHGNADGKSSISKAVYKQSLQDLFTQLKSDFPNATIYLNPFHRRNTGGPAPEATDANMQPIREAHLETIDEITYVKYGVDFYDENLADFTHLTSAGNASFGAKIGRRIASDLTGRANLGFGPSLTNLSLTGDVLSFEIIQNDGGNDWSVPSEFSNIRVDVDGINYDVVAATRLNAGSGNFTLVSAPPAGTINTLYTHWGMGAELSNTSPGVLRDNTSDQALPLKQQIISFVNNNAASSTAMDLAIGWYKADEVAAITDDGSGAVTQWNDKSGNNYHLTQPTAARRPITGTRMLNGKNGVEFNGGQSLFNNSFPDLAGAPALEVFAVFVSDTSGKDDGVYGYSNNAATAGKVFALSTGDNSNGFRPTGRHFNGLVASSDTQTIGTGLITLQSIAADAIYSGEEIIMNGVPSVVVPNNPNNKLALTGGAPQFAVGDYRDGNTAYFDGALFEVLVFDQVLTTAQRNEVGNYLAGEWGIAWNDL